MTRDAEHSAQRSGGKEPGPGASETGHTEAADANEQTGVTANAVRLAIEDVRAQQTTDQRLLSLDGILEIAGELGIPFPHESLTESNLQYFVEACRDCENYLIAHAMIYLAAGELDLQQDRLPEVHEKIHNETIHPAQAYLAALQFVDDWLSAEAASEQLGAGRAQEFIQGTYTEAWTAAIAEATEYEARLISRVRSELEGAGRVGEDSPTSLRLCDAQRQPVGGFTTFYLNCGTLATDIELQNRIVPESYLERMGHAVGAGAPDQAQPDTIVEKFFPKNEYPDQTRVAEAQVEHVVAVVPLLPDWPEALFRIGVDGGEQPYQVDILTGEGCHTANRSLYASKGGRVNVGLPSPFSNDEQYFSAKAPEILGERREAIAELVGKQASTSIVLIMKPAVSAGKASSRKLVLQLKSGELTPQEFARRSKYSTDADDLTTLEERGYVTRDQVQAITAEKALMADEETAAERASAATSMYMSRGGGSDTFGGGMKSMGLHTGASGIGTGHQFGVLKASLETDPFASPKIVVIHPFGIARGSQASSDELAETLAGVVGKRVA